MGHFVLAGTLEKRARWRKEWRSRFCVMRHNRIDYYLQPPAIMEEEDCEHLRGSIPLLEACATEEPGRPFCIRLGEVLLSCSSQAEQQRWLQHIQSASGASVQRGMNRAFSDESHDAPVGLGEPPLMLLPPNDELRELQWHEPATLVLADSGVAASVLVLNGGGAAADGCHSEHAWACCRLPLFEMGASERTFQVRPLARRSSRSSSTEQVMLRIRVHTNEPAGARPRQGTAIALACLCAGMAAVAGGCAIVGVLMMALAVCCFTSQAQRFLVASPQQRRVTFSIEKLERGTVATPAPAIVSSPAQLSTAPLWAGRWRLDKACSDKYEPILADMGVNYLLRKAADTVKSALIISMSETHVTIHVKTLVSVEDCLPLDGSWTMKPVPPGGRMKGHLRVRLTKITDTELEMQSEFPDNEGELRDTLVVHKDGSSFTRTVVRGRLSVARVFRRECE